MLEIGPIEVQVLGREGRQALALPQPRGRHAEKADVR